MGLLLAGVLALVGTGTATSLAAAPEPLLRIPRDTAERGSAAGRLDNPRDVAGDPDTGHLFVPDLATARVNEYTAWGGFVKAWGWDVAPDGAPGDTSADELEVCTTECQAGSTGTGPGQISGPRGLAVDGAGDVYLYEVAFGGGGSLRMQKFDSEGNWLLMLGGEVNKTTKANVCTRADVEAGDVCGAGVPGTADGWFSNNSRYSFIAYGPATETIFVGDVGRIQEFDAEGNFIRSIPLPGALAGKIVGALDVDAAGNFYLATFANSVDAEENVYKLDPSGKEILLTLPVPLPESVALDAEGNVYVVNDGGGSAVASTGDKETRKYLPDGTLDGAIPGDEGVALRTVATNFCPGPESTPPGNVYTVHFGGNLAYVNAFGPGPVGCEPPPTVPPEIGAQYAVSVGSEEAVVRATINPNFFTDTTYFVQYGTAPCSEGGCEERPVPPAVLTGKVVNFAMSTAGIFLDDLAPGTTYRFRFVAESHGGGPVFGPEETFRTFAVPAEPDPCPNDALRTGPGALLPDCRAHEMVSPIDKNNGDVISTVAVEGSEPTTVYQSATSGGRFTYSSASSFADPEGAPFTSQYLATRQPLGSEAPGWASKAISPPRTRLATGPDFQKNQFKAFSADLCAGWLRVDADPPLAPGAQPEYANLYRRENCGPLGYETLTTAAPEDRAPIYQDIEQQLSLELQGASADGSRAIFVANDNLVGTKAPDIGEGTEVSSDNVQLYEHSEAEGLRFVCILPGGKALNEACAAGSSTGLGPDIVGHRLSNLENAISRDGSRIFWTAAKEIGAGKGPGRIYVRIDGTSTVAISEPLAVDPARWWGAAEDGSVAVFSFTEGAKKEDLYRFDVDTKTPQLIAKGVRGVMGMSEDAARIYFVSTKALGGGATEGAFNLYLWEGGESTFIATLADEDASLSSPSPFATAPGRRTSRVSPDGRHAAFSSRASLTGYDNADATSGAPDSEVFLYDAETHGLVCVSCNPSGARPSGQGGVAATIAPWERSLHASRALSDDGRRLFFESFEALVLRDTNGVQDVYQWEAEGSGSCDASDATFNASSGGCVELISSGQSPKLSIFLDATPSGDDVFITTLSSLVPHDPDSVDVYDARVGGGFPPPPAPRPPCEGEACQSPAGAPEAPTPASGLANPGNPKPRPKRCAKGKRRVKRAGKVRCVKKRGRKQSRGRARR